MNNKPFKRINLNNFEKIDNETRNLLKRINGQINSANNSWSKSLLNISMIDINDSNYDRRYDLNSKILTISFLINMKDFIDKYEELFSKRFYCYTHITLESFLNSFLVPFGKTNRILNKRCKIQNFKTNKLIFDYLIILLFLKRKDELNSFIKDIL